MPPDETPRRMLPWWLGCGVSALAIVAAAWMIGFGYGASAAMREMEERAVMQGYGIIEKDAEGRRTFRYFQTDEIIDRWHLRKKRAK